MPGWRAELACTGHPVEQIVAAVDRAAVLGPEGRLGAAKVFTRGDAIVALAPALYGSSVDEVNRAVDRMLASADVVPLIGVAGAREQAYAPAWVLGIEHALATTIGRLADRLAPPIQAGLVQAAMRATEVSFGGQFTRGQAAVIEGICRAERCV